MTALNRLVTAVDRARSSPRLLEVTSREVEKKLICIQCRRVPDPSVWRAQWLAKHRVPRPWCRKYWCGGQASFKDRADHKRWHEDVWVKANMPSFKLLQACQFCDSQLVSVTW